jgi:hypothetical protein
MGTVNGSDSWNEWSKHVLKELQRLNAGQDGIRVEMHEIKSSLTKLSVVENQVEDIKVWKDNISEVASPTQLKELVDKVDSLQSFKTKAITGFVLVQIIIGILIGVLN